MNIFEFKKLSDSYVNHLKFIQLEVNTTFSGKEVSNDMNTSNKYINSKIHVINNSNDDNDNNPSKRQKVISPINS